MKYPDKQYENEIIQVYKNENRKLNSLNIFIKTAYRKYYPKKAKVWKRNESMNKKSNEKEYEKIKMVVQ